MVVALNSDKAAAGDLFWDDGETIDTISTKQYHYIRFSYTETIVNGVVSNKTTSLHTWTRNSQETFYLTQQAIEGVLNMQVQVNTSSSNGLEYLKMDSALIYGLEKSPKSINAGIFDYNADTKVANLFNLARPMTSNWEVVLTF